MRVARVVLWCKGYPSIFRSTLNESPGMSTNAQILMNDMQSDAPIHKPTAKGDYPMKDLVEHIARELVDKPDEVSVSEVEGNQTSVLELKVAKDDLGKVIGKRGRIAQAIRTIVSSVSAKEKKRTVLEIMD